MGEYANIKMDYTETGKEDVYWIQSAQNTVQRALPSTITNLRVP